jgi:hypothetical protein
VPGVPQLGDMAAATAAPPFMISPTVSMPQWPDDLAAVTGPTQSIAGGLNRAWDNPMGAMPNHMPLPVNSNQPWYENQLAQSLEELIDVEGFQWDDLLSGIGSDAF